MVKHLCLKLLKEDLSESPWLIVKDTKLKSLAELTQAYSLV